MMRMKVHLHTHSHTVTHTHTHSHTLTHTHTHCHTHSHLSVCLCVSDSYLKNHTHHQKRWQVGTLNHTNSCTWQNLLRLKCRPIILMKWFDLPDKLQQDLFNDRKKLSSRSWGQTYSLGVGRSRRSKRTAVQAVQAVRPYNFPGHG